MNDVDASLRTVAKSSIVVLAGTLVGYIIAYLFRVIIARYLGPTEYGVFSIAVSVTTIALGVAAFGMDGTVPRFVSYYSGLGDRARTRGTVLSSIKITLPLSLVAAALLFASADWLSTVFKNDSLAAVVKITSVSIPFGTLAVVLGSASIGLQKIQYDIYARKIGREALRLALAAFFLSMGIGVIGVAAAYTLSAVVMPILLIYYLNKSGLSLVGGVKPVYATSEILRFSVPLLLTGVVNLLMGWTDPIIIGYFLDPTAVGVYSASLPTAQLLLTGSIVLTPIFLSVIGSLYAKKKIEDVGSVYRSVTKWVLMVSLPIFFIVALFPRQILNILFGQSYVGGVTPLIVLSFGYLLLSLSATANNILLVAGKTKTLFKNSLAVAAKILSLDVLLIPSMGITGAALASASALTLSFLFLVLRARSVSGISPFNSSNLRVVVAAAASAG